jgi:hypothetical protein
LQKSVILALERTDLWRSEVEARMALRDYESASALAQNAALKEDRLHLLAIIAKLTRQAGNPVNPELLAQMRSLYEQVDVPRLGHRAVEIASDLIWSDPDTAVAMVEAATASSDDPNAMDWAFARLSVATEESRERDAQLSELAEKTRSRIKGADAQEFSSAMHLFLEHHSSIEVIRHVEQLDPKNRLFYLRHWAIANEERADAGDVINYALDVLIRDTPYTPKTRDLRELAAPLPRLTDLEQARALVGRFDTQRATVEHLGSSEDYTRLQLSLAHAESRYDSGAAENRLLELYWYIEGISDLATKTDCVAWMVGLLDEIDADKAYERTVKLHTVTQDALQACLATLLSTTAEHYFVTRGSIRALARTKPEMALRLAMSLNTEARRNTACYELVRSAIRVVPPSLEVAFICDAIKHIANAGDRDKATLMVLQRLSEVTEHLPNHTFRACLALIDFIEGIQQADDQCVAYCSFIRLLRKRSDRPAGILEEVLRRLERAWEANDVGWVKTNIGFLIVKTLADDAPDVARIYLAKTEELRAELGLNGDVAASTFLTCLRLAIRSFGALLRRRLDTPRDLERLERLISHVPSAGERALLWADVAQRCYLGERVDLCKTLVTQHVLPLIDAMPAKERLYRDQIVVSAAPALICGQEVIARERFAQLSSELRDDAYHRVCCFIGGKQVASDPYSQSHGDGFSLSFSEAVTICDYMRLMTQDVCVYHWIERVVNSVESGHGKESSTAQQRSDIAQRLAQIASDRLPDGINIRHNGYLIAARAQIGRITPKSKQEWEELLKEGRGIPNAADRALTLSIIASCIPSRYLPLREEALRDAQREIEGIPSELDRIDREVTLAEMLFGVNAGRCKVYLRAAMEASVRARESRAVYDRQKRIIDIAHRLDPSYAAVLASMLDDDPARVSAREHIAEQIQVLDTKKKMIEAGLENEKGKDALRALPRAAWLNLGTLNAGKVAPLTIDELRYYIEAAGELPLDESYPILAWSAENLIRKYVRSDTAGAHLIPLFSSAILAAEVAERIAQRAAIKMPRIEASKEEPVVTDRVIIKAGERERGVSYIREWLERDLADYLIICDPYFGPQDLEVLQIVRSVRKSCGVTIMTSRKHHEGITPPWDEAYRAHWRAHVSDQEPPPTDVIIIGVGPSGDSPIHERWWLTKCSGLEVGTSFNGLGRSRISDITPLTRENAAASEREVREFLTRERREHGGMRIQYTLFSL